MFDLLPNISIWQTLLSFGFLTILLLLFLVYTRISWLIKAFFITFSLITFFFAFSTLSNSYGWPYHHKLPELWKFSWVEVVEPSQLDPGCIRFWIHEYRSDLHDFDSTPRVYEIPYSKADHKKANDILGLLGNGGRVYGKRGAQGGFLQLLEAPTEGLPPKDAAATSDDSEHHE
jgi:hypothetical protein